ncbi:MAG: hypothetical protein CMF23_17335 [Ignavibacteriae bacterium]|nr:hypothetical protein [Ignavibacteriota bacterium]
MKKLRIINLFILFTLIFVLIQCSKEEKRVAILKFVTHPALNELEEGFINRFNKKISNDDELKNIIIEKHNANANPQTAKDLAEVISRESTKLILAIATPAAQAVSRTPSEIPLIYGAVADPNGAQIIPSNRATGIQNAGYNIIYRAIYFIKQAFPELKTIGTLYNPSEQNSVFVQELVKKSCAELKINLVQLPVKDASEVTSMTLDLAKRVDVIYSANDNTVNSKVTSVISVCNEKKIPFVLGDLSTLSKGAFAAIGLEYKSMGEQLADISFDILKGNPISMHPPLPAPEPEIWINSQVQKNLNITISDTAKTLINKYINNN